MCVCVCVCVCVGPVCIPHMRKYTRNYISSTIISLIKNISWKTWVNMTVETEIGSDESHSLHHIQESFYK